MIVSEVPGTTRDSVDVHFELDDQRFIAIDAALLHDRGEPFVSLPRAAAVLIEIADVIVVLSVEHAHGRTFVIP